MSALRKTEYVAESTARVSRLRSEAARPRVSAMTQSNRERALQMNFGYVLFLLAAAVVTIAICVNYLQLQARYTAVREETTYLETRLDSLRLENDATYNGIISAVDLEHVRETAQKRLGMSYPRRDQIVRYEKSEKDYVRQFRDVSGK